MSRRSLSILLVLLAVIAIGVVWLVREIGTSTEGAERSRGVAARSREDDRSSTRAVPDLTDVPRDQTSRDPSVEWAPSFRERESAATPDPDRELADAIWVQGRVVFPPGTPADEHAEVVAEGARFESRTFHRAAIGPDGSFRVAFARGTGMGVLRLEARYLYLKSYRSLSLPTKDSDIVLRPLLGGCVRGRVLPPLSGPSLRDSIVGCTVTAFTIPTQGFIPAKQEVLVTTTVDENLLFELGGIPEVGPCFLALRSPEASNPDPVEVRVEPGHVSTVDLLVKQSARIAGVVVDPDGKPVGGSIVYVRRTGPRSEEIGFDRSDREVRAGSEGRFEMQGLAAGVCQLWAKAEGAVNSAPTELDLQPGQTISDLTLRLSRGGRIVGQVVDAEGRPDVGVEINASGAQNSGSATADDQGHFAIEKLVPGEYELSTVRQKKPSSGGMPTTEISGALKGVHVDDGRTTEVVIGGPSTDSVVVRGTVRYRGEPAAGWRVSADLLGKTEGKFHSTTCDAQGTYRIVLDHPGWYFFSLGPAERLATLSEVVQVPLAESFERDFDIAGGSRLAGRVLDGIGAAVPGIPVIARPDVPGARLGGRAFVGESTTDAHGAFEIEGVPAGAYVLDAGSESASAGERETGRASLDGVRVGADESIEGLVLTLQTSCGVEVFLRRADGKAVPFASVDAGSRGAPGMTRSFSYRLSFSVSSSTSGATRYELKGLLPGEVTVTARTEDPPLAGNATVVLAPGEKGKVEIVLHPATTLLVRVEATGRDPRDILVVVRDQQGVAVGGPGSRVHPGAESDGSEASERRFGPLSPGRYAIFAEHPDGSSARAEVEVTGGSQEIVTLLLQP